MACVINTVVLDCGGGSSPHAPKHQKSNVLLDWFTVSYRSVAAGVLLVVALLLAAGWYFFSYAPSKPRQEAQEAINLAEERLAEARKYPPPATSTSCADSARSALGEGRDAFQRRQYDDARIAAIRSENFSQKAIDLARGGHGIQGCQDLPHGGGRPRQARRRIQLGVGGSQSSSLRVGDQVKTGDRAPSSSSTSTGR